MKGLGRLFSSSIGSKTIVAFTGIGLMGFVIVHMLGNLQIFLGRDKLNGYAELLKATGGLLWFARFCLLALFVVHFLVALKLWRANVAARPVGYQYGRKTLETNAAAKTMWLSGLVILAFVVYHLLHFTLGVVQHDNFTLIDSSKGYDRHDVYGMVVAGFKNPLVSASYLVAQVFLGMHLYHAGSSMFQTFGLNHPRYNGIYNRVGFVVAVVVVVGNVSIPLAVLLGLIK